ncbi:MAG: superoxide dismutase [bacterium]|nr:superoxide dismutase [bacterium]
MNSGKYVLPPLPYGYKDLEPYISEQVLLLHHGKHHQAYVNGANGALEKLEKTRSENSEAEVKSILKDLSFNLGGHILHSLFWHNMAPSSAGASEGKPKGKGGTPAGELLKVLENEYGSIERFQKEFTQAASSVEGSGWAALVFDELSRRPLLMQIEKHNNFVFPGAKILLVLDVWEHAYYLDYKNDRAKYIEDFWNVVNWEEVGERLKTG